MRYFCTKSKVFSTLKNSTMSQKPTLQSFKNKVIFCRPLCSHLWKFVQNFGKKEPGELEALYTRKSKRRRELNERQGEREKGEKHDKHAEKRGEEGAKKERTEKHKHKKDKEKSEESKRKRGNFSESSNEAKEHKYAQNNYFII